MDPFLISAVIPTKSNLAGLKATVETLWAIDSERIEIIVVDGGGCNATKSWLLENQHRIHHIRSAADGGVYPAMNYGKQCASGQWVWFAGAGDLPHAATWKAIFDGTEALNAECALHVFGVEWVTTAKAGYRPAIQRAGIAACNGAIPPTTKACFTAAT